MADTTPKRRRKINAEPGKPASTAGAKRFPSPSAGAGQAKYFSFAIDRRRKF
jgi:hypothetical protein